MPDNTKKQANTGKNKNRPPKNKTNENNVVKQNESCSFTSVQMNSNLWFGMNIFDWYTPDQLAKLVKDPIGNNDLMREISLILYGTSGACTNTIDYMTAMPTLDRVIVAHGKNKDKKKKNKELFESTLRTIKDKEIVRDALFRGMIEGVAFYYFETTTRPASKSKFLTDYDVQSISEINELGINASIISLPTDYTKIVGRTNSDYTIAFNLDYFGIANGESVEKKLRKYPKEIRDAYKQRKDENSGNGNWVVLDRNRTIVHKIRSKRDEPWGRPLVLAAIQDILYSDYFTSTKRNVLDEVNNKIIWQEFPEGRERGVSALTKQQQQDQHDKVKNAVLNKNNKQGTSFVSVAAGTKLSTLKTVDTSIFDSKNEENLSDNIALALGFAGSLLNGVSNGSYSGQQSNLELVTAQLFVWIEQIQSELNKCISANVIKDKANWCECRYLPITHVNKQSSVENAKALFLEGRGSLSLWAACCGIAPDVFFALVQDDIEYGVDNLPIHQTSYTLSKSDDKGGRPTTDNPTDKTLAGRQNGGNLLPSPSDKK